MLQLGRFKEYSRQNVDPFEVDFGVRSGYEREESVKGTKKPTPCEMSQEI